MHTNLLSLSLPPTQYLPIFSEKAKFSLTPSQKKIILIATATIVVVACLFMTIGYGLLKLKLKRAKQVHPKEGSEPANPSVSKAVFQPSSPPATPPAPVTPPKTNMMQASSYLPKILAKLNQQFIDDGQGFVSLEDIPSELQQEVKSLIEKQNPSWKVEIYTGMNKWSKYLAVDSPEAASIYCQAQASPYLS